MAKQGRADIKRCLTAYGVEAQMRTSRTLRPEHVSIFVGLPGETRELSAIAASVPPSRHDGKRNRIRRPMFEFQEVNAMARGSFLWLLGVPVSVLVLLYLLGSAGLR